ncbi:MAG: 4Fe-4S dicluster domain-containing protein [Gemmatimonadota bacterium]|jgi:formate dehydrogenase iron-sulfur subunit
MKRRDVVRSLCVLGGSAAIGRDLRGHSKVARAAASLPEVPTDSSAEPMAVLVDTTKCMGCRMCELACAKQNDLPEPEPKVDLKVPRRTDDTRFTVVNQYETSKGTVNIKTQCFHCLTPACASACLTQAMHKTSEGPVVWRPDKCMGCRYCMVSCPFDVPKFEYFSANPRIRKCQMCFARLAEGEAPACVSGCPAGATQFGTRAEMLEEGHRRIWSEPEKYVHRIWGEHEVGGTSWLYLSSVPFEEIGLRTDVGEEPVPALTKEFLYAVPFVITLVPPLLLGISEATRRSSDDVREEV